MAPRAMTRRRSSEAQIHPDNRRGSLSHAGNRRGPLKPKSSGGKGEREKEQPQLKQKHRGKGGRRASIDAHRGHILGKSSIHHHHAAMEPVNSVAPGQSQRSSPRPRRSAACIPSCSCLRILVPHCRSSVGADGTCVIWGIASYISSGLSCDAYRGTFISGPKAGRRCCVKRLRRKQKRAGRPPASFVHDISVATAADQLARAFNLVDGDKSTLHFVVPQLLQVEAVSGLSGCSVGEYITVEDFIPGKFEKFVTNTGVAKERGTLSSFAHFTYDQTGGDMLIVDLQGVRRLTAYELTDPCAHSTKPRTYGELDHGNSGIKNFFATHRCTSLCRHLAWPQISQSELAAAKRKIEVDKEDAAGFAHGHR